jgi:hypothetical protein
MDVLRGDHGTVVHDEQHLHSGVGGGGATDWMHPQRNEGSDSTAIANLFVGSVLERITAALGFVGVLLVEQPFMRLYMRGPRFGGYGFWEGRSPPDACAEITGVSAGHWYANQAECHALLYQRAMGWVLCIYTAIYCLACYNAMRHLCICMFTLCRCGRRRGAQNAQRPNTLGTHPSHLLQAATATVARASSATTDQRIHRRGRSRSLGKPPLGIQPHNGA